MGQPNPEIRKRVLEIRANDPMSTQSGMSKEIGCSRERVRQILVAENLSLVPKRDKPKPACKRCEEPVARKSNSKCCSRQCFKKDIAKLSWLTLECRTCGKKFQVRSSIYQYRAARGNPPRFCNRVCLGEYAAAARERRRADQGRQRKKPSDDGLPAGQPSPEGPPEGEEMPGDRAPGKVCPPRPHKGTIAGRAGGSGMRGCPETMGVWEDPGGPISRRQHPALRERLGGEAVGAGPRGRPPGWGSKRCGRWKKAGRIEHEHSPQGPDPEGLAIAGEIRRKVRPAEIIPGGSRAAGDHRPDSDVDLTAIPPDEDAAERTKEILRELLEGKHDVPVVNAHTVTRDEFLPLAQSFPGQAARYGVTPEGRSLDYRPEREPTTKEIRELTLFRLRLADNHLEFLEIMLERGNPCHAECLGISAQWGLERAFKGLLAAGNDPVRFRRDAAFLWRHVESVRPIVDREGAGAVENLLAAAARPDGPGCSLTAFSEAHRRGAPYPDMSEGGLEAVRRWIRPATRALITEALTRSGADSEDLRKNGRRGP